MCFSFLAEVPHADCVVFNQVGADTGPERKLPETARKGEKRSRPNCPIRAQDLAKADIGGSSQHPRR